MYLFFISKKYVQNVKKFPHRNLICLISINGYNIEFFIRSYVFKFKLFES